MDRGAWWATVQGVAKRVGHDLVTKQQYSLMPVSNHFFTTRLSACAFPVKTRDSLNVFALNSPKYLHDQATMGVSSERCT